MHIELNTALFSLLGFAIFSNIPLGYLRQGSARFSVRWFVYIHLSIPFIVGLRLVNHISWQIIPLTFGLAVAGQMIGSHIYRQKHP